MRRLACLALLCLAPLGAGSARAQSISASLSGTVRAADGSPVEGAVVEARSTARGHVRQAVTGRDGRYRLDTLEPGSWTVTARRAATAPETLGEPRLVTLGVLQTLTLDFTEGTMLTETVSVEGETPVIDPGRTGSELRVDALRVEDLPIDGRAITDLALLDASVSSAPAGNFYGERGSVFVLNGQSGRANSFLVDGLDNNDLISNTTLNAFMSGQVIQEFVVLTSQYAPEFGRASGGILNIVTRRGQNGMNAGGFLQGVADSFNGPADLVSQLPGDGETADTSSRLAAGAWASGAMRRDKAFWFASYEHQQADEVTPYTGVGRHGVEGGRVAAPSSDDNLFFRADFNLGSRHFLMTRVSADVSTADDINVGGRQTPETGFSFDESDVQIATSLMSSFGSGFIHEARLLIGRSRLDQTGTSDRPGVDRPSGVFGGNNLQRQERDENRLQIVDNITWTVGDHTWKAGVDVLHSRMRLDAGFNGNGNFLYDTDARFEPGDCGDLFFSYVNDPNHHTDPSDLDSPVICPGEEGVDDDGDGLVDEFGHPSTYPVVFTLIQGEPAADINDTRVGVFLQDTWLAGPVQFHYGLRYDINTYRLPRDARVESFVPNGGAPRDTDNIAPRFGFTWTLGKSRRTLVRGGAGLFYDKVPLGFPAVAAITSGTEIGLTFPQGLLLEITEDVVEEVGIGPISEVIIFPPELILRFSTGTELETPWTEQYSLEVERALGARSSWRARVTRAEGHDQILLKDLNPVVDKDINGIPIHFDDSVGSIAAMVSEGRTWYTALDLAWAWRSDHGWASASYTWSKALDEGPDPLKGGISLPPSTDLSDERGRSDADRRHRFVFSGSVPLPWLDLRASGVVQIASGIPFNVTTGRDDNTDGITTDRPEGVARNTGGRTPLGPVNDLRRANGLNPIHHLEEPVFSQVDLRITRPFGARPGGEARGMGGELFLQVFNLLDRFNVGAVEGAVLSRRFGEPIAQAGPPRTLELGFKLAF